jgi:Arc/MetJ-type ribon-helix-helix transcriptional regulator
LTSITLNPNQEQAVREAIRSGQVASVDEIIKRTLDEFHNGKFIPGQQFH